MAVLNQNSQEFVTLIGWYGSCDQADCSPFGLDAQASFFEIAYQWTPTGAPRKWQSGAPPFAQDFTSFDCGHVYFITLKKGSGSLDVPNLVVSTIGAEDFGRVIESCDTGVQSLEFRWNNIQGMEVLQVRNIVQPTHSAFADRDVKDSWSTVYMFTGDASSYSLNHSVWPIVASDVELSYDKVSWSGLNFSLDAKDGTHKAVSLDAKSYMSCIPEDYTTFTSSTGGVELISGNSIGIKTSDFSVLNQPPYVVSVYDQSGWLVAKLNMTDRPDSSSNPVIYWESADGHCTQGVFKAVPESPNFTVDLQLKATADDSFYTLDPDVEVSSGSLFIYAGDHTNGADSNVSMNGKSSAWPVVKKV
jgi:hypothetical protein